jgi:hypothetical protein
MELVLPGLGGVIILDEEASQVLPFLPINPATRQPAQP